MVEIRLNFESIATRYVTELVFERWLGLPVRWRHDPSDDVVVCVDDAEADELTFHAVSNPSAAVALETLTRLAQESMQMGSGSDLTLQPAEWLDRGSLTTIFHVVSGAEEVACTVRDKHGRFPSSASSLSRLGLLDVPVADVLAEYLLERLRSRRPGLVQRPRRSEVVPTHDVDVPFKYAFQSPSALFRSVAADVVRRRHGLQAVAQTVFDWRRVRNGDLESDPFYCFDRIMAASEARDLQSRFYFIAGNTAGRIDGDYQIDHPLIQQLIRRISERGHLVGLHPSYHAAMPSGPLSQELNRLQQACERAGCKQSIDLVRTHYLRFDPATTPHLLEQAAFREDSSLAFADAAGFRRGTCRSFPLWDWLSGQPLRIVERPLIAMEVSLLAHRYNGHSREEAGSRLAKLRDACARFGGDFVLLWHNSSFESEADHRLYEHAIDPLN